MTLFRKSAFALAASLALTLAATWVKVIPVFRAILDGWRLSFSPASLLAFRVLPWIFPGLLLVVVAGYLGGRLDAFIMRVADIQLSFPAILIALLIDGVARAALLDPAVPRADVLADVAAEGPVPHRSA